MNAKKHEKMKNSCQYEKCMKHAIKMTSYLRVVGDTQYRIFKTSAMYSHASGILITKTK